MIFQLVLLAPLALTQSIQDVTRTSKKAPNWTPVSPTYHSGVVAIQRKDGVCLGALLRNVILTSKEYLATNDFKVQHPGVHVKGKALKGNLGLIHIKKMESSNNPEAEIFRGTVKDLTKPVLITMRYNGTLIEEGKYKFNEGEFVRQRFQRPLLENETLATPMNYRGDEPYGNYTQLGSPVFTTNRGKVHLVGLVGDEKRIRGDRVLAISTIPPFE